MHNLKKYDGKQDPREWLRIYSTAIEVAGGTNSTKAIYFPMALESAPLTWLEGLKCDSIHSWEDLKGPSIGQLPAMTCIYANRRVAKP